MSPIVNDNMVTAAELQSFKCPSCGNWQRDFIKYQCYECEKKFWYEITLDPHWFPKKLEDGTPDWNSAKKDTGKAILSNEWSYGRLNIKTMDYERVQIDREGKKWDYLDYQISTAVEDKKIEVMALRRVNGEGEKKTPDEIKKEIELEKDIEKKDHDADEKEKGQEGESKREKKKEQKEVMKLIDKK